VARVSFNEAERSRAASLASARAAESYTLVLQSLQEVGRAAKLAADSGLSEATVSRFKTDDLERAVTLLSHLGFQVIPADCKVLDPDAYNFIVKSFTNMMQTAPGLVLGVRS
jgi:hypothetical protein